MDFDTVALFVILIICVIVGLISTLLKNNNHNSKNNNTNWKTERVFGMQIKYKMKNGYIEDIDEIQEDGKVIYGGKRDTDKFLAHLNHKITTSNSMSFTESIADSTTKIPKKNLYRNSLKVMFSHDPNDECAINFAAKRNIKLFHSFKDIEKFLSSTHGRKIKNIKYYIASHGIVYNANSPKEHSPNMIYMSKHDEHNNGQVDGLNNISYKQFTDHLARCLPNTCENLSIKSLQCYGGTSEKINTIQSLWKTNDKLKSINLHYSGYVGPVIYQVKRINSKKVDERIISSQSLLERVATFFNTAIPYCKKKQATLHTANDPHLISVPNNTIKKLHNVVGAAAA